MMIFSLVCTFFCFMLPPPPRSTRSATLFPSPTLFRSSDKLRAVALAAIGVAGAVGTSAAFAAGGYIAQHYGWRWAFFAAAIPGVIIAIIFALTVRAPKRAAGAHKTPSLPARTPPGTFLRPPAQPWLRGGVKTGERIGGTSVGRQCSIRL